jgi:hypothetical protein
MARAMSMMIALASSGVLGPMHLDAVLGQLAFELFEQVGQRARLYLRMCSASARWRSSVGVGKLRRALARSGNPSRRGSCCADGDRPPLPPRAP